MLAWYFQKFEGRIGWKDFVFAALLIAVPAVLVKRQPDLGTALLLIASGFYVLYLAGLSWKIIVGLTLAGAAAAPLAWYFQRFEGRIGWKDFVFATVLIAIPAILVKRQPDLGTALLLIASGFFVLYLAGLSWKIIVGLAAVAAAAAPVMWTLLHDYQRRRILTFIDPTQDPLGAGYHTTQASIAIGSGGVVGKGWLNGTQTHLDFLPERHTDFIFAVFGEEFGLVGNALLLLLYLLLIGRGMMITAGASTLFGRLLAGAITLMFFTYAFVNMGMVSGVLPVVGVPLPLVSYGGTALVSLFIGLGILMSVQAHRKLVAT
jgi:rod shape determining protein RodA